MIPQAGSAYAYSYATLGELVAWIIGWDLILEYAVGNVAVAISWGDYFNTLLRGVGMQLAGLADDRLSHGAAQLRSGRCTALLAVGAAHRRHPDPRQPAGVRHRDADHLAAAARRARERHAPTTSWWSSSCWRWRCSSSSAPRTSHAANYHPFAPNGFTGIHQGAAIVFFAYIGFDAISTAAEETQEPAAQPADRHPRRARDLHASSTSSSAPC